MTVAFLVYDSRSGSTYLARKLSRRSHDLLVTPEVNLEFVLRVARGTGGSYSKVRDALDKGRFFVNLQIDRDWLRQWYTDGGWNNVRSIISQGLKVHARLRGKEFASVYLVKKGDHIRIIRLLLDMFPGAKIVYLRRDPRDIFVSKKQTYRPYRPDEVMGWAGPLRAGLVWRDFERKGSKLSKQQQIKIVSFEEMVDNEDAVVKEILSFLGARETSESLDPYLVAPREVGIHDGAKKQALDRKQVGRWKLHLSSFDRNVIDAVAGNWLRFANYPLGAMPWPKRVFYLGIGLMDFGWCLLQRLKHDALGCVRKKKGGK